MAAIRDAAARADAGSLSRTPQARARPATEANWPGYKRASLASSSHWHEAEVSSLNSPKSRNKTIPRSTPDGSNQSNGTEHRGGAPLSAIAWAIACRATGHCPARAALVTVQEKGKTHRLPPSNANAAPPHSRCPESPYRPPAPATAAGPARTGCTAPTAARSRLWLTRSP